MEVLNPNSHVYIYIFFRHAYSSRRGAKKRQWSSMGEKKLTFFLSLSSAEGMIEKNKGKGRREIDMYDDVFI